jgi:hypothetical protein
MHYTGGIGTLGLSCQTQDQIDELNALYTAATAGFALVFLCSDGVTRRMYFHGMLDPGVHFPRPVTFVFRESTETTQTG